jgi:hypothetical protein
MPPLDELLPEELPPDELPPEELPPLDEPPLDEVPASGGGGPHGPQVPIVEPVAETQVSPAQQSALIVQLPHRGTQVPPT